MKKNILLIILYFIFFYIPMVNAEEIPREGVKYFIQYPDGSEIVKETYDEAVSSSTEELLIYSGVTDENGIIELDNYTNKGSLRVKEIVPNGYSTNKSEVLIDLNESNKVEFRNSQGLINPLTGRYILLVLALLVILAVTTLTLLLLKKQKTVPIAVILLLIVGTYFVKANDDNLIIEVKDNLNKPQANVQIEIYAKPYNIDASPAIKFDANGGHFFDGKEVMYYRIPYDGYTREEFRDYYGREFVYLSKNANCSYRNEGIPTFENLPSTLTNDTVVKVNWEETPNSELKSISLNGGYYDFYGAKLETFYYNSIDSLFSCIDFERYYNNYKNNNDLSLVGFDDNASCSNVFDANNNNNLKLLNTTTQYACWSADNLLFISGSFIRYEQGMTWGEWLESPYNTINAKYNFIYDIIYTETSNWGCSSTILYNFKTLVGNNIIVNRNDIILSSVNYNLSWKNARNNGEFSDGISTC